MVTDSKMLRLGFIPKPDFNSIQSKIHNLNFAVTDYTHHEMGKESKMIIICKT